MCLAEVADRCVQVLTALFPPPPPPPPRPAVLLPGGAAEAGRGCDTRGGRGERGGNPGCGAPAHLRARFGVFYAVLSAERPLKTRLTPAAIVDVFHRQCRGFPGQGHAWGLRGWELAGRVPPRGDFKRHPRLRGSQWGDPRPLSGGFLRRGLLAGAMLTASPKAAALPAALPAGGERGRAAARPSRVTWGKQLRLPVQVNFYSETSETAQPGFIPAGAAGGFTALNWSLADLRGFLHLQKLSCPPSPRLPPGHQPQARRARSFLKQSDKQICAALASAGGFRALSAAPAERVKDI